MNALYQFDLASGDGRRTQMIVSASNVGEAVVAMRVATQGADWLSAQIPRDVTQDWVEKEGVRSILRSGTIGVVSRSVGPASPQAMVEALLRGERPRPGQALVEIKPIPGFDPACAMRAPLG